MREITGGRNFLRRRNSKYRGLETRNIPGALEEEEKGHHGWKGLSKGKSSRR